MNNTLTMNYPASWWKSKWREAMPSGNGKIGAGVYGSIHDERILLTHEDLWWKGKTMEMPDVSGKLPEVRSLLFEGKAEMADRILADSLKESGYKPEISCPLPLGDLKIKMPVKNGFKNYSRSLNMENGEVCVQWQDGETAYKRCLFVSRTEDMVVLEISKDGPGRIESEIALNLHDFTDVRKPEFIKGHNLKEKKEVVTEPGYIYYASQNEDGKDFGAVARVMNEDGEMKCTAKGINISNSNYVLVYIKLFVKGEKESCWKRLWGELQNLHSDYNEAERCPPPLQVEGSDWTQQAVSISPAQDAGASSKRSLRPASLKRFG